MGSVLDLFGVGEEEEDLHLFDTKIFEEVLITQVSFGSV
jgi:hypothetical protein